MFVKAVVNLASGRGLSGISESCVGVAPSGRVEARRKRESKAAQTVEGVP